MKRRTSQTGLAAVKKLPVMLSAICAFAQAQDTVEIGAGYNSVDSFKMGEYTGLTDKQGYGVGSVSVGEAQRWNADNGTYWQLDGSNLGLESRSLTLQAGDRGRYDLSVGWRELPHYRFDNPVSTPFSGAGTARQSLPVDWTAASTTSGMTGLQAALQDVAIHTDRETLSLSLDWHLNPRWSFSGEYQHQTKKGNDTLGAIFGSTGGNPRGAILAAPVDYDTDTFDFTLSRSGDRGHASIFYKGSLFSNANPSLRWNNPFNNPAWDSGANFADGAVGEMALAPDNQAWQTGISGLYRFSNSSRISGSLSTGRMTQDESLLPYSNVFSTSAPLPVTRLDGEINTLNALVNFSTRLGQSTNLHLRYTFDERDNDTAVHLFQRVAGDAAPQGDPLSSNARLNRPYSFRNQRFTADAGYRLTSSTKLSFGYALKDQDRDLVDVARTREHSAHVKLDLASLLNGRGWLQYERAVRDASAYVSNQGFLSGHNPDFINTLTGNELFENDPLLRRYHLADRDREQVAVNFTMLPVAMVSLDIIGKLTRDDFPESKVGLQTSASRHLTLNLGIDPPGSDWHAYGYVTGERYRNKQQGYSRRGGGSPTPFFPESVRLPENNWWVESADRVVTAGVGFNWLLLQDKLDLSVDINRSDATTDTDPVSNGLAYSDFSDIDSTLTGLALKGRYTLNNGHQLGLNYRFEKYDSTDFAFDRVAVDSLSNVILLGNASPVYSGYVVEVTYRYVLNQD